MKAIRARSPSSWPPCANTPGHFPREADLFHENEERRVAALSAALRDSAGMILSQPPAAGSDGALDRFIVPLPGGVDRAGHEFTNRYFSHTVASVS